MEPMEEELDPNQLTKSIVHNYKLLPDKKKQQVLLELLALSNNNILSSVEGYLSSSSEKYAPMKNNF